MLLVALLLAAAALAAAANKPHILLVILDDVGKRDTGIYGESNVPMPNIVKLASEGAVLENFYTQPVCSPTRSSLMVGRYPFRFGMQHPWTQGPGTASGIPLDVKILPNHLNSVGYESHMVGKWHAGYSTRSHVPNHRGFKTYLGMYQGGADYYNHTLDTIPDLSNVLSPDDGIDFWEDDRAMFEAKGTYSLDLYDERITKILNDYTKQHDTKQKQAEHPLFVYLAHQTVHIPLQARRDETERCGHLTHVARRIYCSMLVELDDSIGSMIAQYKAKGLWENTLVLFLTDNSGMTNWDPNLETGFPGSICSQGSNFPLRGGKTTLFDGGVRSLGFISGGAYPKQYAGQKYKGLAHVVDLTATILSAAGLYPANRESLKLDGNDLLPLITQASGAVPRTEVPINIVAKGLAYSAIRFGKYKLIVKDVLVPAAQSWFDLNGDLLEEAPNTMDLNLLFDLEQDVEERHDIAAEHPELVRYGLQLIQSYVQGGNYMEPQGPEVSLYSGIAFQQDPRSYPSLHGGAWGPWIAEDEWTANFKREQQAAGVRQ